MVEIKIGIQDKVLRNLVVLAVIPIITLIWLICFYSIFDFASTIVTGQNQAIGWYHYFLFSGIFVLISVLEFFAIIYIKFVSNYSKMN